MDYAALIQVLEDAKHNIIRDEFYEQRCNKYDYFIKQLGAEAFANDQPTDNSLYNQCLEIYLEWYSVTTGNKFKMNGAEGKALKEIIKYLRQASHTKDDKGAYQSFQFIMANWHKLSKKFLRDCMSLKAMNAQLNAILKDFRDGQSNQPNKIDQELNNRFGGSED